MSENKSSPKQVVVQPLALSCMVLHALHHSHETVHGILLGQYKDQENELLVVDAVPVSHGAPTRPLVETALGLVDGNDKKKIVVGWYTAPALLQDTKPSPVALRMAANLDGENEQSSSSNHQRPSCLIVLQNAAIVASLKGESKAPGDMVQALGKDFGKQWLDPISSRVDNASKGIEAIKQALEEEIVVSDLKDHYETDATWYPNEELCKLVQ